VIFLGTDENLKTAFAGESQANRKYLAFSKKAESEGLPKVGLMFRAIAEAETIHALNHLRVMKGIKTTKENLEAAKGGEHYEIAEMYPPMVDEAKKDGNTAAARTFGYALETEKAHHALYDKALKAVSAGKDIEATKYWVCPVCGYTGEGDGPDNCPVCNTKKDRFEIFE
jgi:rubrerythrin